VSEKIKFENQLSTDNLSISHGTEEYTNILVPNVPELVATRTTALYPY